MGFNSGEYGGKYIPLITLLRRSFIIKLLWHLALSIIKIVLPSL